MQLISISTSVIFATIFFALLMVNEKRHLQDVADEHHGRRQEAEVAA
jgi:hypothetical protein